MRGGRNFFIKRHIGFGNGIRVAIGGDNGEIAFLFGIGKSSDKGIVQGNLVGHLRFGRQRHGATGLQLCALGDSDVGGIVIPGKGNAARQCHFATGLSTATGPDTGVLFGVTADREIAIGHHTAIAGGVRFCRNDHVDRVGTDQHRNGRRHLKLARVFIGQIGESSVVAQVILEIFDAVTKTTQQRRSTAPGLGHIPHPGRRADGIGLIHRAGADGDIPFLTDVGNDVAINGDSTVRIIDADRHADPNPHVGPGLKHGGRRFHRIVIGIVGGNIDTARQDFATGSLMH
ncbi:hypothetical protein GCM10027217_25740 [Pseudomaricurvus hydrocarbonicus]